MLLSLLLSSWLVSPAAGLNANPEPSTPAEESADFLLEIRIVESRPDVGEVELLDPEGNRLLLREGDILEEAGGARIKEVGRSTLVLTRVSEGVDDPSSESLVVVRFDASGKTRVREYRKRPDVTLSEPRPPND